MSSVPDATEVARRAVAREVETFNLNWQYRRKYFLEQVVPSGTMQLVERHAPYWLVHYLSEQYGASVARLSDDEWKDIQDTEPTAAMLLDAVPFCEVGPGPHVPEGPSIQHDLSLVVQQPLLPGEQMPLVSQSDEVQPDEPYCFVLTENGTNKLPVDRVKNADGSWTAINRVAINDEPATKQDVVDVLSGKVPTDRMLTVPELRAKADVPDMSEADVKRLLGKKDKGEEFDKGGKRTPEAEAARQERMAAGRAAAKQKKYLAKHPPLPKLPAKVERAPLVLPTMQTLWAAATMHEGQEQNLLLKQDRTWVLHQENNGEGKPTLFDALVHFPYVDAMFWRTPQSQFYRDKERYGQYTWVEYGFAERLSTAAAFFAGRLLGIVQTYQDQADEPHSDRILQCLQGIHPRLDTSITPQEVLSYYDQMQHELSRTIKDRLELVHRMLSNVVRIGTIADIGRDSRISSAHNDQSVTHKALFTICRRMNWTLNVTLPSGYAFFQGMLQPKRTFFSTDETKLLQSLLFLTNKTSRP